MKYGVREVANLVFKAKASTRIGNYTFAVGQPVLYIDSAKTSALEGAATTVYAMGGRGNSRLVGWEGDKTLTLNVEDALISAKSIAMLTGAGLIKGEEGEKVHGHVTADAFISADGTLDLTDYLEVGEVIDANAPIFITKIEANNKWGDLIKGGTVTGSKITGLTGAANSQAFVDFYVEKDASEVTEIQIDADTFAGYYYVEADTLFRRQSDGYDAPVNITLPNVKIQSNFTFTMASTGEPSTFSFTMDAFPGYTIFNPNKKLLCVMQIFEAGAKTQKWNTVMGSDTNHGSATNLGALAGSFEDSVE